MTYKYNVISTMQTNRSTGGLAMHALKVTTNNSPLTHDFVEHHALTADYLVS